MIRLRDLRSDQVQFAYIISGRFDALFARMFGIFGVSDFQFVVVFATQIAVTLSVEVLSFGSRIS